MSKPFEDGVYQIFSTKRSSVDHIKHPSVTLQTGGVDPMLELWIIAKIKGRDGYHIQNRATGRYTYVQSEKEHELVRLTPDEDRASAWDIEHAGGEDWTISLAEHDRLWTAIPLIGGKDYQFETQGRNGEPSQVINFFKVEIPRNESNE